MTGQLINFKLLLPSILLCAFSSSVVSAETDAIDWHLYKPILEHAELIDPLAGITTSEMAGGDSAPHFWVEGTPSYLSTNSSIELNDLAIDLPMHNFGANYTEFGIIIPEFVDSVQWTTAKQQSSSQRKATIQYKESIDHGFVKLSSGDLGQSRVVGGASHDVYGGDLLFGVDYAFFDGAWTHAEDFQRFNGFARYTRKNYNLGIYSYNANWFNTPMIPERFQNEDRYLSLSETDEEQSKRFAVVFGGDWQSRAGITQSSLSWMDVGIEKYENRTFNLVDQANGDQQHLVDDRQIMSLAVNHSLPTFTVVNGNHDLEFAIDFRTDNIEGKRSAAIDGISNGNYILNSHELSQTDLSASINTRWSENWHSAAQVGNNILKDQLTTSTQEEEISVSLPYAGFEVGLKYEDWLLTASASHYKEAQDSRLRTLYSSDDDNTTKVDSFSFTTTYIEEQFPAQYSLKVWQKHFDDSFVYEPRSNTATWQPKQKTTGITAALNSQPNSYAKFSMSATLQQGKLSNTGDDKIPYLPRIFANADVIVQLNSDIKVSGTIKHIGRYEVQGTNETADGLTQLSGSAIYALSSKVSIGLELFNIFNFEDNEYVSVRETQTADESESVLEQTSTPSAPNHFRVSLWAHW